MAYLRDLFWRKYPGCELNSLCKQVERFFSGVGVSYYPGLKSCAGENSFGWLNEDDTGICGFNSSTGLASGLQSNVLLR